jgi:ATP-dependent RNA helicase DDX56/DBP9
MTGAVTFESLGLDYRLLRGIEKKGLSSPTHVQAVAIPKALEGKDIVARAHTGTGKTIAYLAPALHTLLQEDGQSPSFAVIVLVPTSELCEQVGRSCPILELKRWERKRRHIFMSCNAMYRCKFE